MVLENRSHEDILIALFAIEGSVHSLIYQHFDPIIRKHLAGLLNELTEDGDASPELIAFIGKIRENFPRYTLRDLPKVYYDLKKLCSLSAC
jgi:hypothetical protein